MYQATKSLWFSSNCLIYDLVLTLLQFRNLKKSSFRTGNDVSSVIDGDNQPMVEQSLGAIKNEH